jgi:hypothetical protein
MEIIEICIHVLDKMEKSLIPRPILVIKDKSELKPDEYLIYMWDKDNSRFFNNLNQKKIRYNVKHILNTKYHKHLFRYKNVLSLKWPDNYPSILDLESEGIIVET